MAQRRRIESFPGIETRPDESQVGSRRSRNVVFGPGASFVRTRPGTANLTPGLDVGLQEELFGKDLLYVQRDGRLAHPVLFSVTARPDEDGERGYASMVHVARLFENKVQVVGGGAVGAGPDGGGDAGEGPEGWVVDGGGNSPGPYTPPSALVPSSSTTPAWAKVKFLGFRGLAASTWNGSVSSTNDADGNVIEVDASAEVGDIYHGGGVGVVVLDFRIEVDDDAGDYPFTSLPGEGPVFDEMRAENVLGTYEALPSGLSGSLCTVDSCGGLDISKYVARTSCAVNSWWLLSRRFTPSSSLIGLGRVLPPAGCAQAANSGDLDQRLTPGAGDDNRFYMYQSITASLNGTPAIAGRRRTDLEIDLQTGFTHKVTVYWEWRLPTANR